jgi:aarF domain-containing kinase
MPSSSSGWIRVAAGLQKVGEAALQQTSADAGTVATRAAQHGLQLAALARTFTAHNYESLWPHPTPPPPVLHSNASFTDFTPAKDVDTPDFATRDDDRSARDPMTQESPIIEPSDQSHDEANSTQNRSTSNDDDSYQTSTLPEGKAVPSSRLARAMGFASLGAGLVWGTAAHGVDRLLFRLAKKTDGSLVANDANADRVAVTLRRMRGAALKMGQMLSIQDESLLPPALSRALEQVRQGAEAMPLFQLEEQLVSQLGTAWRERFVRFEELPFAAASIGQVHRAVITTAGRGNSDDQLKQVVVKVQYPGVAQSIESDLRNLSALVTFSGMAPKGLFLENVIRVGQQELKVECDYRREMLSQQRMQDLVNADPVLRANYFVVPDVIEQLTTDQVLTSAFRPGGTIDKVAYLDQEERNRIGRAIMYLTIQELFVWRFMQTDPNWGNFLYDVGSRTTSLIDFGATREFSKSFVDGYLRIVWAAAQRDQHTLMDQSHRMNFLTGEENPEMLLAHKLSGFTVGEPFWSNEAFDFRGSNISSRMGEHTSVFLRHRLTPPPEEIYTLHRKLAGAYLLCIKLGAVVHCRDMLEQVVANHVFEDGLASPPLGR